MYHLYLRKLFLISALLLLGFFQTQAQKTWTGAVSTDWNVAGNWSPSAVPTSSDDVIIPSGTAHTATVLSVDGSAHSLTINSGAALNLFSGRTLNLSGNLAISGILNAGFATIALTGSSAQTLNAGGVSLYALEIDNAAGATLTGELNITGLISFGSVSNSTLTTGGFLTLKSSANGTAAISALSNGNSISGDVTVERFIPDNNNVRAWRLLSVPTQGSQSINAAWQEGQTGGTNTVPGYGTIITAGAANSSWAANGFDYQQLNGSLLSYNPNTNSYSEVSSTHNQLETTSGYFMYIRGDRSVTPSGGFTGTTTTVLRSEGSLYQGDVNIGSLPSGHFSIVGNVYASPIDFTLLSRTNVDNSFYVWDPKLLLGNSLGNYQLFSSATSWTPLYPGGSYNGAANQRIETGQAFFVHASGGTGSVTLHESSKVTGTNDVFRPQSPSDVSGQLITSLYEVNSPTDSSLDDVNVEVFSSAYSDSVDNNDALKLSNTGTNLGIVRDNQILSIEGRQPISVTDTIYYDLWNTVQKEYSFNFFPTQLDTAGLSASLIDKYLNTSTPIDLSTITNVHFTVDANPASADSLRFKLVFTNNPVPVTFTNVKAYQQNTAIEVKWDVATESSISHYEVERSIDGINFSKAASVSAKNNGGATSYIWEDNAPQNGANYYRIKSIDINGSTKYTTIVKVMTGNIKSGISIYPNPVSNERLGLQMQNLGAGKYALRLLSSGGQTVYSNYLNHSGGSATQILTLPKLAGGMYKLEMITPQGNHYAEKVIIR